MGIISINFLGKKGREKIRELLVLIFWGKNGKKSLIQNSAYMYVCIYVCIIVVVEGTLLG